MKTISSVLTFSSLTVAFLAACSSSNPSTSDAGSPAPTCSSPGGPASGAADSHCAGQPAQPTLAASCTVTDAGPSSDDSGAGASDDAGTPTSDDSGTPQPGQCGENSANYGTTMSGTSADDDDCKYHVSYSVGGICEGAGLYFMVTATHLTDNTPLTGAYPYAELCLSDTHAAPPIDSQAPQGQQTVVEGPQGTYKIGPVQFDAPGKWTVRFHFNEKCFDTLPTSPHGHAAFFVNVP